MKIHLSRLLILSLLIAAPAGCEHTAKNSSHGDQHGMPKDWKFTLAKGDAAEGRKLFVEIEC